MSCFYRWLYVFVILFKTALTRTVNPFPADEITRRASVRLSNGCSGTLISSNIVYTAAHCVHNFRLTSVSHPSQPMYRYPVKMVFYPDDFGTGWDFTEKNKEANRRKCNSEDCNLECVKYRHLMERYVNTLDYALILLEQPVAVCEHPTGPVAANLLYPSISGQGKTYVPAAERMECFVAGYGTTGYEQVRRINMGIIDRLNGFETFSRCGKPDDKGFYARFHKSNPRDPHQTNLCPGDSGAGIQCISKGGTELSVIGVAVRSDGSGGDDRQKCLAPHKSIALGTADHAWVLHNKILEWNAKSNYDAVYHRCQAFLKQHPYQSVMQKYFGRRPEFY